MVPGCSKEAVQAAWRQVVLAGIQDSVLIEGDVQVGYCRAQGCRVLCIGSPGWWLTLDDGG
jgi:hypothetical protein